MKKLSLIATLLCTTVLSFAQIDDPGGNPDVEPVPLDGGVSLLVIAGTGYAVKKLYDNRKKREGRE